MGGGRYAVPGHLNHHPQGPAVYHPLPTAASELRRQLGADGSEAAAGRRGLAEGDATAGVLTTASTNPLKVHTHFGGADKLAAAPYSNCFEVGQWFQVQRMRGRPPPAAPARARART